MDSTVSAPEYVWVLGLDDEDPDAEGNRAVSIVPRRAERAAVPTSRLAEQMQGFVAAVEEIVGKVPAGFASFTVESVEVSAEISATGKVSFMGSGGELAGKGGITFTLTRVSAAGRGDAATQGGD